MIRRFSSAWGLGTYGLTAASTKSFSTYLLHRSASCSDRIVGPHTGYYDARDLKDSGDMGAGDGRVPARSPTAGASSASIKQ